MPPAEHPADLPSDDMTATAAPGLLLGPMLRHVDRTSATIWVETDAPCAVEVCGRTSPTFTVHGHHYALVLVDELEPGSTTPYEVALDGVRRWPIDGSTLPASTIRTIGSEHGDRPVRLAFGSCRASAPHVPPYTSRLDDHPDGRGVDALRALGLRMLDQPVDEWPDLLLMAGDQVYADDSSPGTAARLERRRSNVSTSTPPDGVVADFEEYTLLYRESWTPEIERWLFSTVPSAMIFDDHDMIDDWNISRSWVDDIRREPWWAEHIVGGLVSYWIHQHLGNLSPGRLREEGMLERCIALGDATTFLYDWALGSEEFTPVPGGYQFSYDRHLGDTHVIVMDVRNGRVLEPGQRRMLDADEWAWVRDRAMEPAEHVVLASSLPVFVPGGLHGIQQWNEAVCDGAWGTRAARVGERLRRAIDLEGWPAFHRSFTELESLLIEVATPTPAHRAPHTLSVVGGDIHFGYVAEVTMPPGCTTTVRQVVCSPLRNILRTRDRRVMRFGASRIGRRIGAGLQARVRRGATALSWELTDGPIFDDNIGSFCFDGPSCEIAIDTAVLDDDGREILRPAVRLRAGRSPATGGSDQSPTERASRTTVPSS